MPAKEEKKTDCFAFIYLAANQYQVNGYFCRWCGMTQSIRCAEICRFVVSFSKFQNFMGKETVFLPTFTQHYIGFYANFLCDFNPEF